MSQWKWFRADVAPSTQAAAPAAGERSPRSGVTKQQRRRQASIRKAADAGEAWETADRKKFGFFGR
ncbi:hypothetical protein OV450_1423 [Actinobacteria bacterium OV450]|nr:hypothetical protein OV450_1423 [Actinobacteria bacterium OV450]